MTVRRYDATEFDQYRNHGNGQQHQIVGLNLIITTVGFFRSCRIWNLDSSHTFTVRHQRRGLTTEPLGKCKIVVMTSLSVDGKIDQSFSFTEHKQWKMLIWKGSGETKVLSYGSWVIKGALYNLVGKISKTTIAMLHKIFPIKTINWHSGSMVVEQGFWQKNEKTAAKTNQICM